MFLTIYGVEKSQCDHSNCQDFVENSLPKILKEVWPILWTKFWQFWVKYC